jgi:tryptophan halogenase
MTMPDAPIDSFRLRLEDDGRVALEFGHREGASAAGVPADPSAAFVVVHRVLMPQLTAWRMVDGLAAALGRPVAAASSPEPAPPTAPTQPAAVRPPGRVGATLLDLGADEALRRRGTTPVNAPPDPVAEKAAWLQAAVRELAPQHYEERSFRIAPGSLQANRYLLSINARHKPADALERAWRIARQLGLPETLRSRVEQAHAWADHLHFGFEGEPQRVMCKLYFERVVPGLDAARARATGEPALQYIAFKWNADSGEHVVSHYHWHPELSEAEIAARIDEIWGAAPPALAAMSRSVLGLATQRMGTGPRAQYLEVTEEGQPRRSFDLNVYDARLTVRDLQGVLADMREYFGVRPGQFQALYDQIKARPMGHLAGGIHRNGQPFFNVYFGGTRQG